MSTRRRYPGLVNRLLGLAMIATVSLVLFPGLTVEAEVATQAPECIVDPEPPEYYEIALISTKRLPGTRMAKGVGQVTFAPSPFVIAVAPEGQYVYDVNIFIEQLSPPKEGEYVVWVTTPNLDHIERLGPLDDTFGIRGRVRWNKFLLVVTLEPENSMADSWQGPIVLRGMSRSGLMHTMAGHGPFEDEPCAKYGYY